MKTGEDLRARAERCLHWARAATDRTVARKFEELARAYRQMADEFDRRPMLRFVPCPPPAGEGASGGATARPVARDLAEADVTQPARFQTSSGRST
ncbi:MAG: hypothetical protein IRY89_10015 [Pseudolabrys sp.]|nr:hypothetical protein [Pseudolabrys sp.]